MTFSALGWQMGPCGGVAGATGQYLFQEANYITTDAAAAVEAAGYFPAAQGSGSDVITKSMSYLNFPAGLAIAAIMNIGATPVRKNYIVTASSSSGVTIALQTTTAG